MLLPRPISPLLQVTVSPCFHGNDAQPHIIEIPGLLLVVPVAYTTLPAPRDDLINQLLLILWIYPFQELFTEEADPFREIGERSRARIQ